MNRDGKRIVAMAAAVAVAISAVAVAGAFGGPPESSRQAAFRAAGFTWLRPGALPAGWSASRLPGSPAKLPAPPGWRAEHGDAGTRTEALRTRSGRIAGYLNATPLQGSETLRNWTSFRVAHNREEGDRDVRLLAGATGLRFRSGTGSCVLDTYLTESGRRYRELACIVSGRSATTVIVGAAPPLRWEAEAPAIEQAIDSFTT
jgi:hypothetical protein